MAFGQTKPKDDITKTTAPVSMGPTETPANVTKIHGGPPAALAQKMQADKGRGVSTAQEDNQVPLIYVLQPLSPQVDKRSEQYVDGAEPGDLWLRNSPNPIVKGDVGIVFQPCAFWRDYGEWVPRDQGGGFVGCHAIDALPGDVTKCVDPRNPNKVRLTRPEGTELVEARSHAGFVITDNGPLPYVIPFTSTGHSVSRAWMFLMNSQRFEGGIAPAWACLYRLRTKQRKNKAGTWFQIVAENAGDHGQTAWVQTEEDYARGDALNKAFETGAKKAEAPVADVGASEEEVPF